jgi:hypothetical protein
MMIWTFLGYPFGDLTQPMLGNSALVGVVAQLCVLVLLIWQFQNHLHRLAQSQPIPVTTD